MVYYSDRSGNMDNFNVKTFDIKKNYAIEASAGTGKTYSIQKIVTRLLESKKNELGPDADIEKELNDEFKRILLVTYTEKATGELKHRIREELSSSFKGITFDIDNANIYTIHSFCQSTINEYGLELNKPFELAMIDEGQASNFIDAFIRDNDQFKNDLKKYDAKVVNDVKNLLLSAFSSYYLDKDYKEDKKIVSVLNQYYINLSEFKKCNPAVEGAIDDIEDYISTTDLDDETRDSLTAIVENARAKLADIDNSGCFDIAKSGKKKGVSKIKDIYSILDAARLDKANYAKYYAAKYLPIIYGEWLKYKDRNKLQTFDDLIRTVREAVLSDESFAQKLREKYRYGIIDEFQDTNQKQWDIFRTIFMHKGNNIIVVGDPKQSIYSFQGSDVNVYIQAVKDITSIKPNDPNGIPEGVAANLTRNWRSTDKMIEACNKVFDTDYFFRTSSKITFTRSASPKDLRDDKENPKTGTFDGKEFKPIWIVDEVDMAEFAKIAVKKIIECTKMDANGHTKLRIKVEKKKIDEFGNYVLDKKGKEITEIVERNVTYNDFAILYRTRSEGADIVYELKKNGVPFTKYKDKGLFSSLECAHWAALLEAINTPNLTGNNIKGFKKALFTKFFDKSLYEINDEMYNLDTNEAMQKIIDWKEYAKDRKWEDLIDNILIESGMIQRMKDKTKLDTFSKFKQIGDFLIGYLSDNHTLLDAIDYLNSKQKFIDVDSDDENGDIVGKGTSFNAVQLMTIYASKGLEFPVVISCTTFKKPNTLNNVFVYKEATGKKILTFNRSAEYSEEEKCEWMRLFYVDYTRASYLLIVPHKKVGKEENANDYFNMKISEFIEEQANSDYFDIIDKNVNVTNEDVDNTIAVMNSNDREEMDLADIEARIAEIKETKDKLKSSCAYKHSYSSLSHSAHEKIVVDGENGVNLDKEGSKPSTSLAEYDNNSATIAANYKDGNMVTISPDFPKGSTIGTALHEVFEKYDFESIDDNALNELIRERFTENGIRFEKHKWVDDANKIVRNVLGANFVEIKGNNKTGNTFKLSSISECDKLAEVEFNYKHGEKELINYFNGFIDLTFRRGNVYSVIDWKSDSLNDEDFESYSNYESLKGHTDKLYSIQRVLYAHILIDWLASRLNKSKEAVFNENFGGVYYVFMKGCYKDTPNGIYAHTWNNYDELDQAYKKVLRKAKVWR